MGFCVAPDPEHRLLYIIMRKRASVSYDQISQERPSSVIKLTGYLLVAKPSCPLQAEYISTRTGAAQALRRDKDHEKHPPVGTVGNGRG